MLGQNFGRLFVTDMTNNDEIKCKHYEILSYIYEIKSH